MADTIMLRQMEPVLDRRHDIRWGWEVEWNLADKIKHSDYLDGIQDNTIVLTTTDC